MKILTLSTFGERCGIATYNDALMSALGRAGACVDVHAVETATARTRSKQGMLHHFDAFGAKIDAYDAIIIQHEYGLFGGRYTSGLAQKVFARLMSRVAAAGKPTAVIFHSEPRTSHRILSRKRVNWARICRLINDNPQIFAVVHGNTAEGQYVEAGLSPASIWATRHPLPAPRIIPRRSAGDEIVLTIFGFVAKYKGYDEAIEALDNLPERYRLVIAGGTHPGNAMDDTFERLKEREGARLEITGWLEEEDIAAVMARTDIVLAPYHRNGPAGSGAVTWAICHGRPVIASQTVSFSEIQEEAGCFAMVPPGDAQALADAIRTVAEDDALKAQMVERGLAYTRKYSWAGMADRLLHRLQAHRGGDRHVARRSEEPLLALR